MKKDDLKPVREIINDLLGRYRIAKDVKCYQLINQWKDIVGPRLGERTRPRIWGKKIKDGILHIEVTNSAWLSELAFIKKDLIAKLNHAVGDPNMVQDLRFHLKQDDAGTPAAQRTRPHRPLTKKLAPPPPAQGENLERIHEESQAMEDPELREIIIRTRTRWDR